MSGLITRMHLRRCGGSGVHAHLQAGAHVVASLTDIMIDSTKKGCAHAVCPHVAGEASRLRDQHSL